MNRVLQLKFWGADVFILALVWALAYAAHMDTTMVTPGPLVVTSSAAWVWVVAGRLYRGLREEDSYGAGYYRSHLVPMLLLLFGVTMAAIWIQLYYVGQALLGYSFGVLFFLLVGTIARLLGEIGKELRRLLFALAAAQLCAMPAFYYSFIHTPVNQLLSAPLCYVGLLFYLAARETERIERDGEMDTLTVCGMLALVCATLYAAWILPHYERGVCLAVAVGAGCLQGYAQLSSRWPREYAGGFCGLALLVPAFLLWFRLL